MKITNFFNSDFKEFSNLDNVRSIPSLIDGFKDSQRKAVFGMFSHGNSEIKVAQLSGYCSLVSKYHHGENSMADTIVGLAQNYPGSNNVNLFEPIGQFGSILSSDSASHRYIFTKPSKNLRKYILESDDCILEYRKEDDQEVEPITYLPIAPFWILNGSVGIGTGHSVKILPRRPEDVLKAISMIVKGKPREAVEQLLVPHYNGWKGTITNNNGQWIHKGVLEKINTSNLRVTELPPNYGIDKFKSVLVDLMDSGKVKSFDNNSTDEGFDIEINVPREVAKLEQEKLEDIFKIVSRASENITLWDSNNNLKRYESVYDALVEFVEYRLSMYAKRKRVSIQKITDEIDVAKNKALFVGNWLKVDNVGKMTIEEIKSYQVSEGVDEKYIDSFMMMRLTSLTKDMIESLKKEIVGLEVKKKELESKNEVDLYLTDIKGV